MSITFDYRGTYPANLLIDSLIDQLHLKNDAALSNALDFPPPVISKIRHGRLPIGATFLIRAHDVSGISIRDLKRLAGLPVKA